MKRALLVYTLVVLATIIALPVLVFASDISDADYSGSISVTNNSTATNSVSVNLSINSQSMVDQGLLLADYSNAVIKYAGSDVAFMPGYSTNPWVFYVDSIGTSQVLSYNLYTGNVSGGKFAYFPGTTGLTVPDNDTNLEPSSNFTISQRGYIDTTQVGQYLFYKPFAISSNVSASGNITASILGSSAPATINLRPNSAGDATDLTPKAGENWDNVEESVADDTGSYVSRLAGSYATDYYNLLPNPGWPSSYNVTSVRVYFRVACTAGTTYSKPAIRLNGVSTNGTQIINPGAWTTYDEVLSKPGGGSWTASDMDNLQVGISLMGDGTNTAFCTQIYTEITYTWNIPVASVMVSGLSSGEKTVKVEANGTLFGIGVDQTNSDSWPITTDLTLNVPMYHADLKGTTFNSVDNNELTCNVTGATWTTLGRSFNGISDYIACDNNTALNPGTGDFTLETWVKRGVITAVERVYNKRDAGVYYILSFSNVVPSGRVRFELSDGTNSGSIYSNSALDNSVWHHIIVVKSGNTVNMYVDNVVQTGSISTVGWGPIVNNSRLIIGTEYLLGASWYGGIMGEMRAYTKALSVAEIAQNYNATRWKYDGSNNYSEYTTIGSGVPNTSGNWNFAMPAAVPYALSQNVTIGGNLRGSWVWQYGSTFTDLSGSGNTATPSFRTTSSNPYVSAVLSSFEPISQAHLTTGTSYTPGEVLTSDPSAPAQMYTELVFTSVPGADAINEILAEADIPQALWWFPFLFAGIALVGLMVFGATHGSGKDAYTGRGSLLTMCVVIEVLLLIMGVINPIPLWPAFLFPIPAFAIISSRKHYALG